MPARTLIELFRSIGRSATHTQGSSILLQGDTPQNVSIVAEGVVRAYIITGDGEERSVTLYGPGDILPFAWAFDQASVALYYYEAFSDVQLIDADKVTFRHAIETNPAILQALTQLLSTHYASLLMRITGLVQSRSLEKLAYTLYYLATRYGTATEHGLHHIDLPLTQGMIASLIGQTRENTAKNIKVLKDKRIIYYDDSNYSVNKKLLESFIGEESLAGIRLDSLGSR